jgi:hypothetical protein
MAKINLEYKVVVYDAEAKRKISKIISLLKQLNEEFEKYKCINIGLEIVPVKRKWYQFWK